MWQRLMDTWIGALVFVATAQCLNTVRVGIIPPWTSVIASALAGSQSDVNVSLHEINTGAVRSAFDKIDKTHKIISSLNLNVVIGPFDPEVSLATESLRIPYLCTTPAETSQRFQFLVQVTPEGTHASNALLDVARAYAWTKVSVFYDDVSGVQVLERMMTNHTIAVRAWRLPKKATLKDVRDALVEMRKVLVEKCVVLCNKDNVQLLLEE
ncbi:unnamed protein product, partial [Candidula unifasciata]